MTQLRERKKRQTRERILAAAGRLFRRQGFAQSTMEEVAAAADVGVGTLYNYFGSKERLLLGVFEQATEQVLEQGQSIVDEPGADALAAVHRLLTVYRQVAKLFDKSVMREMLAASMVQPASLQEFASLDVRLAAQLGQLLGALQARGLVDEGVEIEHAAIAVYGALLMPLLLYLGMDDMDEDTLEQMVSAQVTTVFSGLSPRTAQS